MNIQQQPSNSGSNSITFDSSSYPYLFNNNDVDKFLVFQSPAGEFDVINDNNDNSFDPLELINNDTNDIIIYLSRFDNENKLSIEENSDFNTINNIHEENGYDQVNNF